MATRIAQWRVAWVCLALAIGLHVTDEALTGFLPVYNAHGGGNPSETPLGTSPDVYVPGLAGRTRLGSPALAGPHSRRVSGRALDPRRVADSRRRDDRQLAGSCWGVAVLGQVRSGGLLLTIPAHRRRGTARHSLTC